MKKNKNKNKNQKNQSDELFSSEAISEAPLSPEYVVVSPHK